MLNAARRRILTEKSNYLKIFAVLRIGALRIQQEALLLHNVPQKLAAPADPGTYRRFTQAQSGGDLSVRVAQQQLHLHDGPVRLRETGKAVNQRVVIADSF